jgi:hypothetical protein
MKAFELDKGLRVKNPSAPDDDEQSYWLPPHQIQVYKEFQRVGQLYDRSISDRVWNNFVALVCVEPVKDQEIKKTISQVYRIKEPSTGKEWLTYNCELFGRDWQGNAHDYSWLEGVISMPEWTYDIDPRSNKIMSATTQVFAMNKKYIIPFTKEKVSELSKWFKTPLSCIVIALDGRKYSCSLNEFRDMEYDSLVNLKTGFTEFMQRRRGEKVYT